MTRKCLPIFQTPASSNINFHSLPTLIAIVPPLTSAVRPQGTLLEKDAPARKLRFIQKLPYHNNT